MHTPNPQLRAREGGEWEQASAEPGGGGEDRKGGEKRKGGKQREGELRVGVVKKKSKGEVVGWEGRRGRAHSGSNADTRSLATLF